jgi:hypothetical protein
MALREAFMERMREVGRESERSIAMTVLRIERHVEWKTPYGEEEAGARVCT